MSGGPERTPAYHACMHPYTCIEEGGFLGIPRCCYKALLIPEGLCFVTGDFGPPSLQVFLLMWHAMHVGGPRPEGCCLGSVDIRVPVVDMEKGSVCRMLLAPIVEGPANKAKHGVSFAIPPVKML